MSSMKHAREGVREMTGVGADGKANEREHEMEGGNLFRKLVVSFHVGVDGGEEEGVRGSSGGVAASER